MMALKEKILVTVDGSDRSLETIKHIAKRKPFQKKHLVLFNVFISLPDFYWDIENEPQSRGAVVKAKAWEAAKKNKMEQFMKKAQQILFNSGFPKETVTVKIQECEDGIARDIIKEAHNEYCAVVINRTGAGAISNLLLGSKAVKVIEKLSLVPVFIEGSKPPGNSILIAMDSSECSMQAIDFSGELMGGLDFNITLLHAVRGAGTLIPGAGNMFLSREDIQAQEDDIHAVFDQAKHRLINFGFKPENITSKIIADVSSRAKAIVQEAKQNRHTTIVVGRRGLSKVQEFFMGSVSNKVIQLAEEQAVWVVT
jgi:nucleotide-binding universal stress UspA family protein